MTENNIIKELYYIISDTRKILDYAIALCKKEETEISEIKGILAKESSNLGNFLDNIEKADNKAGYPGNDIEVLRRAIEETRRGG